MIVGLIPPTAGDVVIDGVSMTTRSTPTRQLRRRIQMMFQDPMPASIRAGACATSSPSRSGLSAATLSQRTHRARVDELLAAGRPDPADGAQVPARILRRPAPAHRDRARASGEPGLHRLRRADLGARRVGAGADPQPDARSADRSASPTCSSATISPWCATWRPHRRDVSRTPGRDGAPRKDLFARAAASLYAHAARRGARPRSERASRARRSRARFPIRSIRRPVAPSIRAVRYARRAAAPSSRS